MSLRSTLLDHLTFLYGPDTAAAVCEQLLSRIVKHTPHLQSGGVPSQPAAALPPLNQADSILITYPDQFQAPPNPPLSALTRFCETHLAGLVSGVHLLPFFPSSSDDGFSVIDYRQVDPDFGSWQEIARLGRSFRLVFDLVANHASLQSAWFQGFLSGDPAYQDWFVTASPAADLSRVVRPRALPLLTTFDTTHGKKWVWTTFSADQVDLNYANPAVLLEMIDVLLGYAARGAQIIRLDAVAYLWKEPGSPSIHLPQTHRVVQLFRTVLEEAAPGVLLLTETNVPHADNLAYFGSGTNEAHMVYNFALPPLALHTFLTGDTDPLSRWAASLRLPSPHTAFFNFLASHDGIGLNPARGLLTEAQIDALVAAVRARGGLVSEKDTLAGRAPYELNINYLDALSAPEGTEPPETTARRFLACQAVMLALPGLPGIYVHSLLGSRGWPEGVHKTGQKRAINRQKFDMAVLESELVDPGSLRAMVFSGYSQLLRARASSPAFHPYVPQRILDLGPGIFALLRMSKNGDRLALCLHSALPESIDLDLDLEALGLPAGSYRDLVSGQTFSFTHQSQLSLSPYSVHWFEPAV